MLMRSTSRWLGLATVWGRRLFSTTTADASLPSFEKPAKSLATATFDWQDPLCLSASLTDEEKAIYETARSFAQKELLPGIVAATRAGTFDRGIMRSFGQMGLLGLTIPAEYGGGGAGYVSYGLCARAVEQVDSGYRSAMSVQSSLVMHPLSLFGSDEQKQQWLPQLAEGAKIGCFGLTEPDHGSDPSGMATKATWDAGAREWVLSGSKTWITNSPIADVLLVWARAGTQHLLPSCSTTGHAEDPNREAMCQPLVMICAATKLAMLSVLQTRTRVQCAAL
jgi:hypothetical protein